MAGQPTRLAASLRSVEEAVRVYRSHVTLKT